MKGGLTGRLSLLEKGRAVILLLIIFLKGLESRMMGLKSRTILGRESVTGSGWEHIIPSRSTSPVKGYYKVTGVAKGQSFISDSIAKVRSVILQKYGVDIAQDYLTNIDFGQSYGVDGPSAGVTMAILLCSLIEGKPIRQDVAVTGEINLGVSGSIQITAVGGVHEKIKAAEAWGFKKVVIPKKNYLHSVDARDYTIDVMPAETLDDYLKECLVEQQFLKVPAGKYR